MSGTRRDIGKLRLECREKLGGQSWSGSPLTVPRRFRRDTPRGKRTFKPPSEEIAPLRGLLRKGLPGVGSAEQGSPDVLSMRSLAHAAINDNKIRPRQTSRTCSERH